MEELLANARAAAAEGNMSAAMNHIIRAITAVAGEEHVQTVLRMASQAVHNEAQRSRVHSKNPEEITIDEISGLLENIAISRAPTMIPNTIVSKTVVDGALMDGTCYTCKGCGGVVTYHRKEAHDSMWCPALDK